MIFPRQYQGALQTSLDLKLSTHLALLRVLALSFLSTSSTFICLQNSLSLEIFKFQAQSQVLNTPQPSSLNFSDEWAGTTPVFASPSGSSLVYEEAEALELLLQTVARCPG